MNVIIEVAPIKTNKKNQRIQYSKITFSQSTKDHPTLPYNFLESNHHLYLFVNHYFRSA